MSQNQASKSPEMPAEANKKADRDCPRTPFYLSLWDSLMTADGNAVEAHPSDDLELAQLRERGLVRGKKWRSIYRTRTKILQCNFFQITPKKYVNTHYVQPPPSVPKHSCEQSENGKDLKSNEKQNK